jgi:hypothetical protein
VEREPHGRGIVAALGRREAALDPAANLGEVAAAQRDARDVGAGVGEVRSGPARLHELEPLAERPLRDLELALTEGDRAEPLEDGNLVSVERRGPLEQLAPLAHVPALPPERPQRDARLCRGLGLVLQEPLDQVVQVVVQLLEPRQPGLGLRSAARQVRPRLAHEREQILELSHTANLQRRAGRCNRAADQRPWKPAP